ncbi:MAG: winged helix-turn-helix transcriptional regulator [Planctomyces sp.]|nr:winged helix-turn-helix transcriptional regulator [Planctomyces sp.]
MNEQTDFEECSEWLKALAEPLRLRIVRELIFAPCTVTALANRMDTALALVSHHVQVLLHADIVQLRKDGRFNQYSLNPEFFRQAARQKAAALDFGCCRFEITSM